MGDDRLKYSLQNIYTTQQIQDCIDIYNTLPANPMMQSYNLFHVDRRTSSHNPVYQSINNFMMSNHPNLNLKPLEPYYVMYESESFTAMHYDIKSTLTCVTLLEDKDLVGGETLVYNLYEPKDMEDAGMEGQEHIVPDNHITPEIVNWQSGQTLIYGQNLPHGVCKVVSGHRLVLVQWFV